MRFHKILNFKNSPKEKELIQKSEEALSARFSELALAWNVNQTKSGLGGDALQLQLVVPFPHYADLTAFHFSFLKKNYIKKVLPSLKQGTPKLDLNAEQKEIVSALEEFKKENPQILVSAATDGVKFFWEPEFLLSLSPLGQRLLIGHESGHAVYLHPTKCGNRNKKAWNIAIDYRTNYLLIQDLRKRGFYNAEDLFIRHLGQFITLNEFSAYIRNPYHPPPKLQALGRIEFLKKYCKPGYSDIDETIINDELPNIYYAEPALSKELQQPEAIYDYLLAQIPKCLCCNKLMMYHKPTDYRKLELNLNGNK